MSTQRVSAEPIVKRASEVLLVGVDFTNYGLAPSGETLNGTPTATVSGMTTASVAVNVATFTNRAGGTVAIGKGIQFTLSGGTAGTDYEVIVTSTTTAGQTLSVVCPVHVRAA